LDGEDESQKPTTTTANENESSKAITFNPLEIIDDPEIPVRDLEARHLSRLRRTHLSTQARQILLLAASLHIKEG
jgi:hypothetical protein